MNDPSSIQMLMFVFPANEVEAVYHIDAIRAVYDPVDGSPAERLATDAAELARQIEGVKQKVQWTAVPADRAAALRARIPELAAEVKGVLEASTAAATDGFGGHYNEKRATLDRVRHRLGEFVLADKAGFYVWQRSPYTYVLRDELPDFSSPEVGRLDLQMAGNEFRDRSFMVSAGDADVELEVSLQSPAPPSPPPAGGTGGACWPAPP
jgi:hypothetical protein